jgi:Cd2+/Zn2+-exporting ATPase
MSLLTLLAGVHIFKKALIDIRYRIVGIDLLVSIAVIAAFIIGDYFEAAAVTYLFTIGHILEKNSLEKTRSALKTLMDLKPTTGRRLNENVEDIIPFNQIKPGDVLDEFLIKLIETTNMDKNTKEQHINEVIQLKESKELKLEDSKA